VDFGFHNVTSEAVNV